MRIKHLLTAENILHVISILLSVFLIVYLVTYVAHARERGDCQMHIKAVLIDSIDTDRQADMIESTAMDNLLNNLLAQGDKDSQALLRTYQEQRFEAQRLRANSPPLPAPVC